MPQRRVGHNPLPRLSLSLSLSFEVVHPSGLKNADVLVAREPPNYRSRSRSPRRDNYRDSYNPYRDERRDERRGANGRERSFSPVRGQGGRDSRTSQESDVIQVDSSAVGLIIGRAGENMRRIEAESGARVQFITGPEGSGPKRQCRVSGNARQRADAIADIFRTQAENHHKNSNPAPYQQPPPRQSVTPSNQQPALRDGERSSQIMVPDKTVGLIIGRGGETIRDLQERSGCHVNITSESQSKGGYRPVNLIGDNRSAARAKEMIYEIVDSDTRANAQNQQNQQSQQSQPRHEPYQAPPATPNYGPSQYANAPPDPYGHNQPKETDATLVPSEAVGMIIGKGGETIKDMQAVSGCKINVSQPQGADIQRHIELIGSRPAVEHAKRLIWEKVSTVRDKQTGASAGGSHGSAPAPTYGSPVQYPPGFSQPPSLPPPRTEAAPQGDPYAPYGGYQNYMAMWAAAYQGQGQPPPT